MLIDNVVDLENQSIAHLLPTIISTLCPMIRSDERFAKLKGRVRFKNRLWHLRFPLQISQPDSQTVFPFRYYPILPKMADNICRVLQDIDLRVDDEPIPLPIDVVNQAAAENRFIIIGRPLIPRHQNIRSLIAPLPRLWGQAGLIHGRITEGRQFQFVFPTEEAMETVLRRGPWEFAERMLVLQRWSPLMNPPLLDFIPFWIQIRGIPLQFLNQEVVAHIGRRMGRYTTTTFSATNSIHSGSEYTFAFPL